MGYVISADEIKEQLPGYIPGKSEQFHLVSAKIADRAYIRALKTEPFSKVILMSGGSASGKTEYVSEYLKDEPAIIVDGTLPTLKGASIKIKKGEKSGKHLEIHAVLPKSLRISFLVFLNRERKFGQEHFLRTHSNSRNTLLSIAKLYPAVRIKIILSEYIELKETGAMKFTEIIFSNHNHLIEYLETLQYTEDEIRKDIAHDL